MSLALNATLCPLLLSLSFCWQWIDNSPDAQVYKRFFHATTPSRPHDNEFKGKRICERFFPTCHLRQTLRRAAKQDHNKIETSCTIPSIVLSINHEVPTWIRHFQSLPSWWTTAAPNSSLGIIAQNYAYWNAMQPKSNITGRSLGCRPDNTYLCRTMKAQKQSYKPELLNHPTSTPSVGLKPSSWNTVWIISNNTQALRTHTMLTISTNCMKTHNNIFLHAL